MSSPGQRKLLAIVFTDMVGYSALSQRDEALALRLLGVKREMVRRILPEFGGEEIKTTGDGFLLAFGSALEAVRAAVQIQTEMHEFNASGHPGRSAPDSHRDPRG